MKNVTTFSKRCDDLQQDIHLTGAIPHMHKRGKAMEYKVFYPNGRSEVLLNVPRYDFSWQTIYHFKQSIAIPKGTRFMVTGYLDNSAKNKNNPDPARAVRFGEPTYDEMMIGWIEYTVGPIAQTGRRAQWERRNALV